MHIPSREELHLKTKEQSSTSSTNTNLYCEDGTTLDQPTEFAGKPRNTQTVPFPWLARKQLCSSEEQWPRLPGTQISSYVLKASLAKRFLET